MSSRRSSSGRSVMRGWTATPPCKRGSIPGRCSESGWLKRRCLYHWIDYPSAERELAILGARRPELGQALAAEVVAFVQRLRAADLTKVPGIAETIDWAAALEALGAKRLEAEQVEQTLGALLKYQEDVAAMKGGGAAKLLDEVRAVKP